MALTVKANRTPCPVPAPTRHTAVALSSKSSGEVYVAFLCPTPHGDYFLFVNAGGNCYLAESLWEKHVREFYDYLCSGPIDKLEVTFNA